MGLKKKERFLIITDKPKKRIADIFLKEAKNTCDDSRLVEIPLGKVHGEEPPEYAAKELMDCDVALLITTKSLSHTKARKNASVSGARIASMPGINEGIIKRAIDVDYGRIIGMNKKLCAVLSRGKEVMIKTKKGTHITLSIKGRKCLDDNGIYDKQGKFGNLPGGEVCLAPIEGSASGRLVVDKTIGGIGKPDRDIVIDILNGMASTINGGKSANKLKKFLKKKDYCNVAELGIGTNPKARAKGATLEDEKILGTAHIAFGNNVSFGGRVDVPFHIDCVFSKPTIFVDGKVIVENGIII